VKTEIFALVQAMRILSIEIHSDDGVANAAIGEAAERLEELHIENKALKLKIEELQDQVKFERDERLSQERKSYVALMCMLVSFVVMFMCLGIVTFYCP